MTIKVTFEADSMFDIGVIPDLVFVFMNETEVPESTFSDTDFIGTSALYGNPIEMTGTGIGLLTETGTIDSFSADFGSEIISFSDTDFYFPDVQIVVQDYFDGNDYAFLEYLVAKSWDMTLSNNDDIATRGTVDGGTQVQFNLLGDDTVRGMGGNDKLYTGDGADKLFGNSGADELDGGSGADRVYGGRGADIISGSNGNDRLFGNAGADDVTGGRGNDVISGGFGSDDLSGSRGKDKIYGNNGDDNISGGGGADKIYAGRGTDHLYGNGGADDFIFRNGDGANFIHDFNATNHAEDINLRGVSEITSFADLSADHMTQVGADVVIDDGRNLSITLIGVDMNDLGAQDFIF